MDIYAFFGFNSLVQTIGPAAALHGTTGVFVDDDNFTVFHDIVNVAGKQHVRAQCSSHVVHQHNVARRVQRLALIHNAFVNQQLFNQYQTTFGQVDLARFLINREVTFPLERVGIVLLLTNQVRDDFVHFFIHFRAVFSRTGNDQRRTRFIDQDGVDFIDQRIVQFTLNALFRAKRHVVAQVVKAVFVVGTVSNIGIVGFTLGWRRQARHVDTHGHAEKFKQRAVIFGVTLSQVVVHGNHVYTLPA